MSNLIERLYETSNDADERGFHVAGDMLRDAADALEQQAEHIAELETQCRAWEDAAKLAKKDASRYQWLREGYVGFDFEWNADENGDNGKQVLCFEMDDGMRVSANIDASIDAAIAASESKKGE